MFKAFQFMMLIDIYFYTVTGTEEEFCISEVFQPRCSGPDEVIVVLDAHFGRKHIGRCLKDEQTMEAINEDERFLGCYSDVKHLVSPKCSGKTSCEIRVAELPPPMTCFNFLRSYLGVSFRCIRMIQNNRQCLINLVDSEAQYLLIKNGANNCGSTGHPWTVEALTGQRIQSTLMDFSKSTESDQDQHLYQRQCFIKIGHIYDRVSNNNFTLCAPRGYNSSLLFSHQSKSNALEIGFETSVNRDSLGFYVIKLQTTGCSDLIPPADAWLKRTENEATIGCYSTRLRWQLKCVGQRWIGVIGNCSYGHELIEYHGTEEKVASKSKGDQTVAIITIGMCGVVASLLITCIGMICIKKYHTISKTKSVHMKIGHSLYNNGTLPILANKASNNDVKDIFQEDSQMNGTILPNDYQQQYFELDQAFVCKDSVDKID